MFGHNAQHYVQWKTNRAHQRYHHQLFCIAKYSGVKGESICSKAKAWLKLGDATSQWSHAQQNGLKRKGSRCCTWCFPRHRGLCKPFFSRDYIWDGTLSSFLFPIFEKHESLSSKSLLMQWFTDKIQTSGCILVLFNSLSLISVKSVFVQQSQKKDFQGFTVKCEETQNSELKALSIDNPASWAYLFHQKDLWEYFCYITHTTRNA